MKEQILYSKTKTALLIIAAVALLAAWPIFADTPEMSGGNHIIQRDAFSSGGMIGRAGGAFSAHDIIGQSSPMSYPDSGAGDEYWVTHGYLVPGQYDTLSPQSWIWVDHLYTPDTFIVVHWLGDDPDSLTTGSDSGILFYDVQYSDDWGTSWNDWLVETIDTTGIFGPATMGTEYWFRVRATDGRGNVEPYPTLEDSLAKTTVDYLIKFIATVAPGGDPFGPGNQIGIEHHDTSMTVLAIDSTQDSSYVWCIPSTDIDIHTLSSGSDSLERWFTNDITSYLVGSAFSFSAEYWHQHRVILSLLGTDPLHEAELETFIKFAGDSTGFHSGIYDNWVDNQGDVRFSEFTTGVPHYRTMDVREWTTVTDAIIDTIDYNYLAIVIRNSFAGLDTGKIIVDRDTVDSPYAVYWGAGTPHVIEAVTPQLEVGGQRYVFMAWNLGGTEKQQVVISSPYISEYMAYFSTQYPITVTKSPEDPYGWISWDDDTVWGRSQETFWSFFMGEHKIEVSDSDAYADTIWLFNRWDDYRSQTWRYITAMSPGPSEYTAFYNDTIADMNLSFTMSDSVWNVDSMHRGETKIMEAEDSIKVVNDGDLPLDWGLWIRDGGIYWAPDSTPARDRYTLRGRFTLESEPPTSYEFQYLNDLIYTRMKWSNHTVLGPEGFDVPPTGWSFIWLKLQAPSSSSYPTFNELIRVGILCRAHMP